MPEGSGDDGVPLDDVEEAPYRTESDTWVELGPPARAAHVAVFDTKHRRMIVFGGSFREAHERSDVWVLELDGRRHWEHVVPRGVSPSARAGAAAVYDPIRRRMLIIGGADSTGDLNDVWSLSLDGRFEWSRLRPEGAPPLPRMQHSATLDPEHDRVLVYGGAPRDWSYPEYGDLWQLSLSPRLAWVELHPLGPSPPPRADHSAVFASDLHGILVFGGACSAQYFRYGQRGDTWFLSTRDSLAWRELAPVPTGDPDCGLRGHTAVYDEAHSEMLVLGGGVFSGCYEPRPLCRVFSVHANAWTSGPGGPDRPWSRIHASAVLDPSTRRVILFGGEDSYLESSGSIMADSWALTLGASKSWSRLVPDSATPEPSRWDGQNLVYDPDRDRLLFYDGLDVWTRSLRVAGRWARVAAMSPPPARKTSVCIYDSRRGRLVVSGGYDPDSRLQIPRTDTWALSLDGRPAWSRLSADSPAQEFPCAIYDPEGDRLVQDGISRPNRQNETWFLSLGDTPTWTKLPLSRSARRSGASAVYDSRRQRMLVFGGGVVSVGEWTVSSELWELPLSGSSDWRRLETTPSTSTPERRALHGAVYDPDLDRMIIVGGHSNGFFGIGFDDVGWSLDLSSQSWDRIDAAGGPAPRWRTPLVAYDSRRQRMVVAEDNFLWSLALGLRRGAPRAAEASGNALVRTPAAKFALLYAPNPSMGPTTVELSLPDAAPAALELLDLQGRRLWASDVGTLGAGQHRVRIAPGILLAPGVYLLRLSRGNSRLMIKLVQVK